VESGLSRTGWMVFPMVNWEEARSVKKANTRIREATLLRQESRKLTVWALRELAGEDEDGEDDEEGS
jgi:hypothetical protein